MEGLAECFQAQHDEDFYVPTEQELEQAKVIFEEKDVGIIQQKMEEKINFWKKQKLRCGITGASGSGKSSFINTVRNLKPTDDGAAAVGVNEVTKEPTPYPDPKNPNLIYYDLPGVGTERFPKDESYLDKVEFESYDFFLIMSSCRFTEIDIWLAQQIHKVGKHFYFVRTKVDEDVRNQKRDYGESPETVLKTIRAFTNGSLEKHGFIEPRIYLLSNHYPELFDFSKLVLDVTNSLPEHKKEAMSLSIHNFSQTIILEKKKVLKRYIYFFSSLSAIGAAVPVPGVLAGVNIVVIMAELAHYRHQFGLNDDDLKDCRVSNEIFEFIKKTSSKEAVLDLFSSFAVPLVAEELSLCIPIFGLAVASSITFYTTFRMLNFIVNKMADISLEIMEDRFKSIELDVELREINEKC